MIVPIRTCRDGDKIDIWDVKCLWIYIEDGQIYFPSDLIEDQMKHSALSCTWRKMWKTKKNHCSIVDESGSFLVLKKKCSEKSSQAFRFQLIEQFLSWSETVLRRFTAQK